MLVAIIFSGKTHAKLAQCLWKGRTGKPDFVFRKVKLAVFMDGCFWHGCPRHATRPKSNLEFWRRKFSKNKQRDVLVTRTLRRAGWRVVHMWEHELARTNLARLD